MEISIITIDDKNIEKYGFYCTNNQKSEGYLAKKEWYTNNCNKNISIKIAIDKAGNSLGFVEFAEAEKSWKPIEANNYLVIHCIMVKSKNDRNKNIATLLLQAVEDEGIANNKLGISVLVSDGVWAANKKLFEKNNYKKIDSLSRFDLYSKRFNLENPFPTIINWELQTKQYQGWNIIYSDQCPWHIKSVNDLVSTAKKYKIDLNVIKLYSSIDAQKAPSGFANFSLIYNGKLLEDHYISSTRFENILKKETKSL